MYCVMYEVSSSWCLSCERNENRVWIRHTDTVEVGLIDDSVFVCVWGPFGKHNDELFKEGVGENYQYFRNKVWK
jgi:hypothetical protein